MTISAYERPERKARTPDRFLLEIEALQVMQSGIVQGSRNFHHVDIKGFAMQRSPARSLDGFAQHQLHPPVQGPALFCRIRTAR